MKKIIFIVLVLVVLTSLIVLVVAPWKTDSHRSSIDVSHYGDWLQQKYPNEEITEEKIEKNWCAEYTYSIVQQIEDQDTADVHLDIILKGDGVEIPISASGEVPAYQDDTTGWIFWHGPIDGTAIVNDEKFPVTIGFSKDHTKDDIHATIQLSGLLVIGDEESWEKIADYVDLLKSED